MSFDQLRSGKQQISDELHTMYKRLTDPEEIEKARIERERETFTSDTELDAGL